MPSSRRGDWEHATLLFCAGNCGEQDAQERWRLPMERSRELAKQKICSYLKADGLPVSTTGAPGKAFHGL